MTRTYAQSLAVLFLFAAAAPAQRDLGLTVYNTNFALVKDQRALDLKAGVTEARFTDVASTIEPSSVRFRSLTDPEAKIVEQNYQFDLVGSAKLLEKYVDKSVELLTEKGELLTGKLLKAEEKQIILQDAAGIRILAAEKVSGIRLSKLPQGLLTRPTLVCQMFSPKSGKQTVQLDYLASNIKWDMNYNAVIADDEKNLDLVGWVTINNGCDTAFADAKVSLVAGEPNRPQRPQPFTFGVDYLRTISKLPPTTQRGKETAEQLGEYHLYRLPERTTVAASQIKQIKLISAEKVPVEKMYLYDGAKVQFFPFRTYLSPGFGREESNKKVNVILAIENRADRNLGVALPPGLVRIFKRDKDQSQEFTGEDKLPATSANERILLYMGDAFDLVGERTQTDFKRISDRVIEEAFKIEVKNHKKEAVTLMVIEKMYRWSDWEIIEKSQDYEKLNARTIRFLVPLKPDQTQTIEYRVRYTW